MPRVVKKQPEVPTEQSTTVRLSITNDGTPSKQDRYLEALKSNERQSSQPPPKPTVRLAVGDLALKPPSVRLAHVPGAQGDNVLLGQRGVKPLPVESRPALLVSYWYLEQFEINKHRYHYRDWALDSGAFSAFSSGAVINLQEYIDCCKRLRKTDTTLTDIFALDVIGDWKASIANTEVMWEWGVEAIPCFHYGEPWEALIHIAQRYPKIALGGMVGQAVAPRDKWIGQCFSRVWPKKIHGFGLAGKATVMKFPFHSTDATNWEVGPCRYGRWNAFGGRCSVRGSKQNLRAEVEWYLELERQARERWKREMAKLEALATDPTIRLALLPRREGEQRTEKALIKESEAKKERG